MWNVVDDPHIINRSCLLVVVWSFMMLMVQMSVSDELGFGDFGGVKST